MLIEQAIFTSAQTRHRDGYQLVSTSPGVHQDDARELSSWGPSHDSLLPSNTCVGSVNFHRLDSGLFCISKSLPAGFEYSERGGHEIYTHFLIVSPDLLSRFANDPFRLLEAASAIGKLNVLQEIPRQLEPFPLLGRVTTVDNFMLEELIKDFGPITLAFLIQQALNNKTFGISGVEKTEHLFAGLLNLLPPECRCDFSFTTGLKHSPRRDYRWIRLPEDQTEHRRLQRQSGLAVIDLSQTKASVMDIRHGWAALILDLMDRGKIDVLADFYELLPANIYPEKLEECANHIAGAKSLPSQVISNTSAAGLSLPEKTSSPKLTTSENGNSIQQAHGAHPTFTGSQQCVEPDQRSSDSKGNIDLHCEWLMDKLGKLDDVVFDALDGKEKALEELQAIWPVITQNLAPDLLEESREEYLRYALSSWISHEKDRSKKDPQHAMAALNVLCLLFNEIDNSSTD